MKFQVKFTRTSFFLVFFIFLTWLIGTSVLLIGVSGELAITYFLYIFFGIGILFYTRRDIFSPIGLFVIACFQAFGMNIPFFAAGYLSTKGISESVLFVGDATMGEGTLTKMIIILLCAEAGFVFGYLSPLFRVIPLGWVLRPSRPSRKVTISALFALIFLVIASGAARIQFHLGEAGVQPIIPFAGFFQYLLYNGVLILCLFYITQGMRQGNKFVLGGLIALLGVALTQVLLSWRGGIIYLIIMLFFIFWNNQIHYYHAKKMRPLMWLAILTILIPSFVQLGNSIRAQRLGGEVAFASTKEDFVFNILNRSQGSTRLAVVVNEVGPLTFTSGYRFIELFARDISATKYIDQKIYGVLPTQSHSVGTSGPGGIYFAGGILGVLAIYFVFGAFFRSSYECVQIARKDNVLCIVWYGMIALLLFDTMSENLNISTIKYILALAGMTWVFGRTILQR